MRFYFNVTDGHGVNVDTEGTELADKGSAMVEALKDARQLMSSSDARGACRRHWRMNVVDESGSPVFSLPFGHALEPDLLSSPVRRPG